MQKSTLETIADYMTSSEMRENNANSTRSAAERLDEVIGMARKAIKTPHDDPAA